MSEISAAVDGSLNKKRSLEELLSGNESTELSKVDRRKLKKQRKKVLAGKGTREDFYDIYGANAKAEVTLKLDEYLQRNRTKLKFTDIQSLILWVLGEAVSPRWAFISNKPLIEKVVVVVVDGLTEATLKSHGSCIPCLAGESEALKRKLVPIPLEIPSSLFSPTAVIKSLLSCPLSRMNGVRKDKSGNGGNSPVPEREPSVTKPLPLLYTMSWAELKTNEFPLPRQDGGLDPGFVATKSFRSTKTTTTATAIATSITTSSSSSSSSITTTVTASTSSTTLSDEDEEDEGDEEDDESIQRRLFAVDCEMCYTHAGLELARVSLIDHMHRPLYDSLVKPHNPITDYNTRFSGLTEEHMRNVTTTIEDVQREILKVISSDDILCGHSLENDLKAMKIVHTRVIDTSLLYPHPRGPPFKSALRHLTKRWLGREIQTSKAGGHDSIEDAKAALELVQLKLKYGPQWGIDSARADNFMSVLSRYRRAIDVCASAEYLTNEALFPPIVSAHQGATDAIRIDNAVQALKKKNDLILVCLHDMMIGLNREDTETKEIPTPAPSSTLSTSAARRAAKKQKKYGSSSTTTTPTSTSTTTTTSSTSASSSSIRNAGVESTNKELERLLGACAPNTMVIIVSGQTAAGTIRKMQMRKVKALQKTVGETWSVEDDATLNSLLEQQLAGVAFVAIK